MMLVEETLVPDAALPVAELKRHLRLGTGFGEDDLQDAVLGSFLRAAMAAVEARTSKILMRRGFVLTLSRWREGHCVALPVAPVTVITEFATVDRWGAVTVVDEATYVLERDSDAPKLLAQGGALPRLPAGGTAEIRFTAGLAVGFDELPVDLIQAVMLLAAHYYDHRDDTALGEGCMPFGVTSLLARYRPMRLGAAR